MSHKDDLDELIVKGQELLERSTGEARAGGDTTWAGGESLGWGRHHMGRG